MKRLVGVIVLLASLVADAKDFRIEEAKLYERFDAKKGPFCSVKPFKAFVPMDWRGKVVEFVAFAQNGTMELKVNECDLGRMMPPVGVVNLSGVIRYGETNDFVVTLHGDGQKLPYSMRDLSRYTMGLSGKKDRPVFRVTDPVRITDVFAKTSWRERRVDFEVEIEKFGEFEASRAFDGKSTLVVDVQDEASNVVKTLRRDIVLTNGINLVTFGESWPDARTWELNAPYLYTAKVTLESAHASRVSHVFTFGFREYWRDGKDIYLNGHKCHFRIAYPQYARAEGVSFLRLIGYNAVIMPHAHQSFPTEYPTPEFAADLDRMGIAIFGALPSINKLREGVRGGESRREYERYVKLCLRRLRNHPSLAAFYTSVNSNCPIWNNHPDKIAQIPDESAQARNIDEACEIARKVFPGVLYYSHADGSCGDISSNNSYLNWTPLQEREDWLEQWSEKGLWPYQAAEWGQPYLGSYYNVTEFCGTEYWSIYWGERAYEEEPEEAARQLQYLSLRGFHGHGHGSREIWKFPLFWDLQKLFAWRSNRAYRSDGLGGGLLYFNIYEGWGDPQERYKKYDPICGYFLLGSCTNFFNVGDAKPSWANPNFDGYQWGNKDLCCYIGGSPRHTDKTHAYYAGEKIEKQLVVIWDGPGEKSVKCRVQSAACGVDKTFDVKLKTGDIRKLPFEVIAPNVKEKTSYRIVADFGGEWTDAFDIEVYPKYEVTPVVRPGFFASLFGAKQPTVKLFDPKGESEDVLKALGIAYEKIASLNELRDEPAYVVIGKNAMENNSFDVTPAQIISGLRILMLPQTPQTLEGIGFRVQDTMSRQLYAQDRSLGLCDDELSYWRGAPKYGKGAHGSVMDHNTRRGPRWTRIHTVAGLVLEAPQEVGFIPQIDGEFDMNYAALMTFSCGKGAIHFCTLDFERRMGVDPAATRVARAVFRDFLTAENPAPAEVRILRNGARDTWPEVCSAAEEGTSFVIVANDRLAREAGFGLRACETCRVAKADSPAFKGCGQNLWRWREPISAQAITTAPAGWQVSADGFAAEGRIGAGRIVFIQADAEALINRYNDKGDKNWGRKHRNVSYSAEHARQLVARVATNLGAQPSEKVLKRLLYVDDGQPFDNVPHFQVLGPFAAKDETKAQLDVVFPGEDYAIRGDSNPNPVFNLPQGGTANWRPTVLSDENGKVDLASRCSDTISSVHYAQGVIKSECERDAILKLGCDWRMIVWLNGEKIYRSEGGPKDAIFPVKVHLKKGENVLAVKIGGGLMGNAFWVKVERPKSVRIRKNAFDGPLPSLYRLEYPARDPYTFTYW